MPKPTHPDGQNEKMTILPPGKPIQDMRFDVSVIGVATVEVAAEAQMRVIAVEAGRTLLLEKDALLERAARANISIVAADSRKGAFQTARLVVAPPRRKLFLHFLSFLR